MWCKRQPIVLCLPRTFLLLWQEDSGSLYSGSQSLGQGGVHAREKGQTEHAFSSALGAGIAGAHCYHSVLFRPSFTDIICLSADRWLFLMGTKKTLMLKPSIWPC